MEVERWVWVFNGERQGFPGGVFSERDLAEEWIRRNSLTGVLTKYPLDVGVYDWAVSLGRFKPKRPDQRSPYFMGGFSDAGQEHYHYENGVRVGG